MPRSGRGGRGPLLRAAAAAAPLVDKVPSLGLVLRLLQECHRGEGSPWRGYLESLPPLLPELLLPPLRGLGAAADPHGAALAAPAQAVDLCGAVRRASPGQALLKA